MSRCLSVPRDQGLKIWEDKQLKSAGETTMEERDTQKESSGFNRGMLSSFRLHELSYTVGGNIN